VRCLSSNPLADSIGGDHRHTACVPGVRARDGCEGHTCREESAALPNEENRVAAGFVPAEEVLRVSGAEGANGES
jgi:hypothetical protein